MTMNGAEASEREYQVVVNDEGQYSLLLQGKETPRGWRHADKTGTKTECLTYIKEVWTDMTPVSLRNRTSHTHDLQQSPTSRSNPSLAAGPSLVDRLCEGDHLVEIGRYTSEDLKALQNAVKDGYIHIKFSETAGGTELGIRLDSNESDLDSADFEMGVGILRLVGRVTLNQVPVFCIANIDLATLKGTGHLTVVQ